MTIVLFNLNWGYQIHWREANQVLDIMEDPTSPGPHRSPQAEAEAQAKLTRYQNTDLFASNITLTEQTRLSKAIQDTRPGWQFYREAGYLYAWKECWAGVMVGGQAPEPLKAKSARGLADRIRLYEAGRKLVKERLDGNLQER